MLRGICRVCHRQLDPSLTHCGSCGAATGTQLVAYDLVLGDRTRFPLIREVTIGRSQGNTLRLTDPSVSRRHARLRPGDDGAGPVLADLGSSYGTWVDGERIRGERRLADGATIVVGDQDLVVERQRAVSEPGRTMIVPAGASVLLQRTGHLVPVPATQTVGSTHPRLRSGYALKRLAASEGPQRWVLKDLVGGRIVRLSDEDARLVLLVDGTRTISQLVSDAETVDPRGPARLALLLADLGARDMLAEQAPSVREPTPVGRFARLARPRVKLWPGAGDAFDRVYRRGAWLVFTRPVLALLAAVCAAGVVAFGFLVVGRYGTPFVIARKVGLGGLVFLIGRLGVAVVHEAAHALTMASFGRRVGQAGIKFVLFFPYTFVDTSDAWFESRRRRIAVSAAGPVSDLSLAGLFSLACVVTPAGPVRDVFFQLAFGAYYGALFNLNPLLERDGYHVMVDWLRQPNLRRLAMDQLRRRLSGHRSSTDSRMFQWYAASAVLWMFLGSLFAIGLTYRYRSALSDVVPGPAATGLLAAVWLGLLGPPLSLVLPSLRRRASAKGDSGRV